MDLHGAVGGLGSISSIWVAFFNIFLKGFLEDFSTLGFHFLLGEEAGKKIIERMGFSELKVMKVTSCNLGILPGLHQFKQPQIDASHKPPKPWNNKIRSWLI